MGRLKPSWYYEKQAQEAQAREQYFLNRPAPPDGTAVVSRGSSTDLFYRSLLQKDAGGTDPVIYKVSVYDDNLAIVSATEAGLMTALGTGEVAQRLRGSGVKPTKVHWYKGATTPVRMKSEWNTSWTKYYDTSGGRSHYSTPFSKASGAFTAADLQTQFNALFGEGGSKRTLALGTQNGRAYLEYERVPLSAST